MSFQERLAVDRPVLLDGALGTELARRGVPIDTPIWTATALLTAPEEVQAIHREYVSCGAELLTANTFRTHTRSLRRIGRAGESRELTKLAVDIAQGVAGESAWVAGSQGPLEDCYSPQLTPPTRELEREHRQMSEHLAAAGADVILAETLPTIREVVAVTESAQAVGIPVMLSFVCGRDGQLLSGESLARAVESVLRYAPLAIMVNCLPAETAATAVGELMQVAGCTPVGVYANVGWSDDEGRWTNTDATQPAVYAERAAIWLSLGAKLIGGCCGTTPAHIAAVHCEIGIKRRP